MNSFLLPFIFINLIDCSFIFLYILLLKHVNHLILRILNKDLDMRSSMSFQNTLTNVFVTQGIVGAMLNKSLHFINMLGGNSIALSCDNYNEFIDFYYDGNAPYLYALDRGGNLVIYSIKLTLSKQHANECFRKHNLILI